MKNQTTCPTCLDYSQSIESTLDEINLLLTHAEQAWQEHPECTIYRGRLDVAHIVKRRLGEMLCITPETLPEPNQEIVINPYTGSIDIKSGWNYETEDGSIRNAVDDRLVNEIKWDTENNGWMEHKPEVLDV